MHIQWFTIIKNQFFVIFENGTGIECYKSTRNSRMSVGHIYPATLAGGVVAVVLLFIFTLRLLLVAWWP